MRAPRRGVKKLHFLGHQQGRNLDAKPSTKSLFVYTVAQCARISVIVELPQMQEPVDRAGVDLEVFDQLLVMVALLKPSASMRSLAERSASFEGVFTHPRNGTRTSPNQRQPRPLTVYRVPSPRAVLGAARGRVDDPVGHGAEAPSHWYYVSATLAPPCGDGQTAFWVQR